MRGFLSVVKALADENRVRAVLALRWQPLCVCQITELLALAPSTVSKHMSILKQARLVDSRKNGRWIYYRLADEDVPVEAREALAWVKKALCGDSETRKDDARLAQILKLNRKCSVGGKPRADRPNSRSHRLQAEDVARNND